MSIEIQWHLGDVIVMRGVRHKRIDFSLPMFVVLDTQEQVALYYPAGTKAKSQLNAQGERPTVYDLARHYSFIEPEQDTLRLIERSDGDDVCSAGATCGREALSERFKRGFVGVVF